MSKDDFIITLTPPEIRAVRYVGISDGHGGAFAKDADGTYVVLLSARDKTVLIQQVERVLDYIENKCTWFVEDINV